MRGSARSAATSAEPVEPRHHHVADHQVGRVGTDRLERLLAVADGVDARSRAAQQPGQVLAHVGVVVGDSTRAGGRRPPAGQRSGAGGRCVERVSAPASAGSQRSASWTYGSAAPGRARTRAGRRRRVGGQVRGAERQPDGERGARALDAVGVDACRRAARPAP